MRKVVVSIILLVVATGTVMLYRHTHMEWVLFRDAESLAARGDWPQAQREYRELLARETCPVSLLRRIGDSLEKGMDLDGAAQAYEQLAKTTRDAWLLKHLAGLYARLGRFDRAADWYRQALAAEPADRNTRIYLARILTALGQFEQAIVEYRLALRETGS